MTRARASLVSLEDTPYYHCTGRCVRRAFLCGVDTVTNRSFEHRRIWIQERLELLTETFAVDLCAYALMSNHYHLVVRVSPERAAEWSDREVIERWTRLYAGTIAARKYLEHQPLSDAEKIEVNRKLEIWRERLGDLSWYMRSLNEYIARKANAEDGCTGHFWESRFNSQALLDETALLTVMAYVDLNPIRAKMADSIENSDYTSVQDRWRDAIPATAPSPRRKRPRLAPFSEAEHEHALSPLPFNLKDYLDLIDTTGRIVVAGKRGFIPGRQPKLLDVLDIDSRQWLETVIEYQRRYELAIGKPDKMIQLARRWGKRWLHGITHARRLYPVPSG